MQFKSVTTAESGAAIPRMPINRRNGASLSDEPAAVRAAAVRSLGTTSVGLAGQYRSTQIDGSVRDGALAQLAIA